MIRAICLVGTLFVTGALGAGAPMPDAVPALVPAGADAIESIAGPAHFPEVRLRKLHLVRPDLIPYPIAYDVVC